MADHLDLDEIDALLKTLKDYDVTEFRWLRGEERLSLRRGSPARAAEFTGPMLQPVPIPAPHVVHQTFEPAAQSGPLPPSPLASKAAEKPAETADRQGKKPLVDVTSPMVGTFYRRPAVDAEPYVEVGDMAKKGQILCIVEAMKLMNEIESTVSGRIVEICLEDTQMVEYGEVLFRIEPTG